MGKFFDSTYSAVAITIITFIALISITKMLVLSIVISIALGIIIVICYNKLTNAHSKKYIREKYFDTYLIIQGIHYQLSLIQGYYKGSIVKENYIIYQDSIIIPIIKFSSLSKDDIIKSRLIANSNSINNIYIISNNIDRTSISFSSLFSSISYKFVRTKVLYNLLKHSHSLPEIDAMHKKKNVSPKVIISTIFSRANAPRYLLASFMLLMVGIFTPLRPYYLTLSAITSIFTLISLFTHSSSSALDNLPPIKKDLSKK